MNKLILLRHGQANGILKIDLQVGEMYHLQIKERKKQKKQDNC